VTPWLAAVLLALVLALASALGAVVLSRAGRLAFRVATLGTLLATAVGFAGALVGLVHGDARVVRLPWELPFGEAAIGLDPLSAFFLVCAMAVAFIAALHSLRSRDPGVAVEGDGAPRPARLAGLYALTVAAVLGVTLARDGVLFLVAWEGMTVASWLLVGHDEERAEARRAAMTYLIASQVGAAALYVLFALLAAHADGFGFEQIAEAGPMAPALAGTAFALAVGGFGAKAAFFPLHLWAPDAYPAAPPPAAALLSGALSKMGIYGIARALLLLAPPGGPAPAAWWGDVLVVVGAATAASGALNALARRDLPRLVAYSSVENLGIVALGLGVGLLGRAHGSPLLAFLGFSGALLHVLNHGLMKSLLLLLAGDVAKATGTRTLDRMGGLARRMPVTAGAFLVGAVAISGLPPGNGFVSEWLVLTAGLRGAATLPATSAAASALAVVALALASGLAGAAFAKAFGLGFLGSPRSTDGAAARDPGGTARAAVLLGAGLCVLLGLTPALAALIPFRAAEALSGPVPAEALRSARSGLTGVTIAAAVLLACAVGLAFLRRFLLRGREVREGPVWGCGYEAVGPRLQYTASGFPDPVIAPLGGAVPRRVDRHDPEGYFPGEAHYHDRMADAAGERVVLPLVHRFVQALGRVRVLQAGRLQLYLLYVLAALVLLLAWQLVLSP
jgi:hydrogenase-4 component B